MRGSILRRTLALLVVMLMLNTAVVSAQVSGGMKGDPATEETEEEATGGSGPCWSRNRDDVTDPEEAGLAGRRQYESPQFGYVVEWSRDWVLDEYFDTPVISFPSEERDALCLWLDDTSLYSYVYIIGQTASRGGPDADLEEWTDPGYIDATWEDLDVEVVIADATRTSAQATFHIVDPVNDLEYYTTYVSIEQADDSMIYITFVADAASFEDAYAIVAEDITLDGETMFDVIDWDDIEAEL